MPGQDIFADDWRECLRAHYKYIIGNNDKVTEKSLNEVMAQAGFTEADLYEMRLEVTMHVDDSGADYVPDAAVVEYFAVSTGNASAEVPAVSDVPPVRTDAEVPVEVEPAAAIPMDEEPPAAVESTSELVAVEEMDESEVTDDESDEPPPAEEPPSLTQLSLF
jgi:hypothetical protein